ncbi:MAG: DUF3143 domain-containing protein [Xenococcaceae cyanobacterium]
MVLPDPETPLYSHPLPELEKWLTQLGCEQDKDNLHCWQMKTSDWKAEICLEVEELTVRYLNAKDTGEDLNRSFKYSLSRQDVEAAVLSGP